MTQLPPRFTHDCTACRYLGQYEALDVYWCPQPRMSHPTIVARSGNDGPEYVSMPIPLARELVGHLRDDLENFPDTFHEALKEQHGAIAFGLKCMQELGIP